MPNTGTFGGFDFDPEVFAEYMAEQPTWNDAILASGIVTQDNTIMDLIGTKGNVATLPFYKPISVEDYEPLNNDGKTDNTPVEIEGGKQTAMLIQRMKAFKAQDFIRELTGADPIQHVGSSIADYQRQVKTKSLMQILNGIMGVGDMGTHITDISTTGSTVADTNKIDATTMIYAQQKALGDMASGFGLAIMHSAIYAHYQALGLVEFMRYNEANGLTREVNLPTINGLVVLLSDRYTVDTTGSVPKYITTIAGRGAFLGCDKTNYENAYYVDYDPEATAGVQKLYTKHGYVLHPNGLSLIAGNIAEESPTDAELANADSWMLAFNEKNVKIGQIISNG